MQPVNNTSPAGTSSNPFFTVSNLLSLTRALLAIPFAIVMLSEMENARWWGGAIMVVGILTDKFDGVLARRLNQTTEWGKILDPLADKVGVGTVVVVLLLLNEIPLWFVGLVLVRDVVIFAAGIYLRSRYGVVLPSNEAGKWAVGILSLGLFLLVLGRASMLTDILMGASALMLVVSSYFYAMRFARVVVENRGGRNV